MEERDHLLPGGVQTGTATMEISTNIGTEDLVTIMWANEVFIPQKPDTYYEEV